MTPNTPVDAREKIAALYNRFAERSARGRSPLVDSFPIHLIGIEKFDHGCSGASMMKASSRTEMVALTGTIQVPPMLRPGSCLRSTQPTLKTTEPRCQGRDSASIASGVG